MSDEHPLRDMARQAPEEPGVYRFLDARKRPIYVGKARNIRRRVLSYFGRSDLPERTRLMLERARNLDFTVTASEVEAFILENTLIKKHRPRFNVLLRDDKTYPYLRITTGEQWPKVELTRRVREDKHEYYGPYMGQYMARKLMDLARTRFQIRTCHIEIDGKLPRPCLYWDMNACLAPCVDGLTTPEAYAEAVNDLRLFLDGRHRELLPRLEASMWAASEREEFELAARLRDLIAVVERLREKQDVEAPGKGDLDVFSQHMDGEHATVCVLAYRTGKLTEKREFHFESIGDVAPAELLVTFLAQYYEVNPAVPPLIETRLDLNAEDRKLVAAFLKRRANRSVRLVSPKRGHGVRRTELAHSNSISAFELRFRAPLARAEHLERRLGEVLNLPGPVQRLECFDISHSVGKETTASCVVWVSGRMEKRQYRSFSIRDVSGIDDYAAIAEAVTRRYKRLRDEDKTMPDLVLIDGGLGQLNAAMAAVDSLGLNLSVASLAKREELVWLPGENEPLRLSANEPAHLVLRQARDEAHRFAVARHRKRRSKRTLATELLALPGIGPGRARSLLKRFGSVKGVQSATIDELQHALGPRLGKHVWEQLHAGEESSTSAT